MLSNKNVDIITTQKRRKQEGTCEGTVHFLDSVELVRLRRLGSSGFPRRKANGTGSNPTAHVRDVKAVDRAVLSVQGQQSYSLCSASAGMCLLIPSALQLIRAALLAIISEWSLIGECVPLGVLSHCDFHLHCLQQVIMRNMTQRHRFLIKDSF